MIRAFVFLRAATVSAVAMLPWSLSGHAAPETAREGVFSIGIPTAGIAEDTWQDMAAPAGPTGASLQSIWALGADEKWDEAASRLRALSGRHAGWQAPAELTAFISAGQRNQQLREALAAKDWTRALALLPPVSGRDCESPFHIWSRGEALEGVGGNAELQAFYVRILTNCEDPALIADLASRAGDVLDASALAALIGIPSLAASTDPSIAEAHAGLVRAEARLRFAAAQTNGDLAAAGALASASADTRLLAQAGWMFLESDAPRAAGYFRRAAALGAGEDAYHGLVLAALAAEDHEGARTALAGVVGNAHFAGLSALTDLVDARARRAGGDWIAAVELADRAAALDPDLRTEAQSVSGGALLDAASSAYDEGDFGAARYLAARAATYPPTRRAGEMRAAWSDLQAGDVDIAAAAFRRLYIEAPDTEAAEGFALAAGRSGKLGSAAEVARRVGGPLGGKVQAQYASAAFYKGDYLTARALAPQTYDALEGVDRTVYRQTLTARRQGGGRGENRLAAFASTSSVETGRDVSRYEAGVTLYRLDNSAVGSAGRETFAAPYLAWRREGETSLAARISLLPIGGSADPAAAGEVAAVHAFGKHVGQVRAFVRPKTDSLLAFSGGEDAGGADAGRVSETGALVRGRFDIGGGRSVQAEMAASHLDGQNTVSNSMVSAGVSASQAITKDGFDYLVSGPFYQFQSYDRNTNFFTPGHGGYFSPQQFHRLGWSLNAHTASLRNWIVKADGAVAFESVREDAAVAFPLLQSQGAQLGGGTSSGMAGALDLAIGRRLGPELIATTHLSATASKAFEDFRIGIGFAWVPGGRAALVPSDLTTDPFAPGSWIRP